MTTPHVPLYRRLMNLRCPKCATVQPAFNLSSTFKGGFSVFAINDYAPCISCPARLRLVPTGHPIHTLVMQLLPTLFGLLAFLAVLVPLIGALLSVLGIWGLVPVFLLFAATPFIGAVVVGHVSPLYRKVVAL